MSANTKQLVKPAAVPSVVYDAVRADPAYVDGRRYVVKPACEAPSSMSFCLTCRQRLANGFQVHMHTTGRGAHVIARLCDQHGPEEQVRR